MNGTDTGRTSGQAAPRRQVEDAWSRLQRRYAVGAATLAALLLALWATGYGPGGRPPADDPGSRPPVTTGATGGAPREAGTGASAPASGGSPADTPTAPAAAPATAPTGTGAPAAAPAAPAAPRAATEPAGPEAGAATPAPLPGAPVARLYFEPDQAWPTGELGPRLAPVLARLKAEPDTKALVSGFHDRRGSVERNTALAQKRAQAVRRVLIREGVPAERIVLAQPQQSQGSGPDREARRVEVTVAR